MAGKKNKSGRRKKQRPYKHPKGFMHTCDDYEPVEGVDQPPITYCVNCVICNPIIPQMVLDIRAEVDREYELKGLDDEGKVKGELINAT